MSGLNCPTRTHDALTVANIGDTAHDFRCALLALERFHDGMQRRFRMFDHQQPGRAKYHNAVADLGTDRTATSGHDDRLAADKIFQPAVIDLHAGPQQKIFDRHGRQLHGRPARFEGRHLAHVQAKPACTHQDRFGASLQCECRGCKDKAPHPIAAAFQIGHDAFKVVDIAENGDTPYGLSTIGCRRRQHADRPDFFHRSAFDPAQQHLSVGGTSENQCGRRVRDLHALQGSRIMEVAVDDPQAAQEKHLQEPVQKYRDLAEKECPVNIRGHQHVIEREQRDCQHSRRAKQVVEIRDRGETPFVSVHAEDEIDHRGVKQKERQKALEPAQPFCKGRAFEAHQESDDNRRHGGQQIVQHDQNLARCQFRNSDHA